MEFLFFFNNACFSFQKKWPETRYSRMNFHLNFATSTNSSELECPCNPKEGSSKPTSWSMYCSEIVFTAVFPRSNISSSTLLYSDTHNKLQIFQDVFFKVTGRGKWEKILFVLLNENIDQSMKQYFDSSWIFIVKGLFHPNYFSFFHFNKQFWLEISSKM